MKKSRAVLLAAAWTVVVAASAPAQTPLGTAFTYQGLLSDAALPANGTYDLQFVLFDAATAGAQVGSPVVKDDVMVTNGLFTVTLDFGAVFGGSARWLEIGVRPGASGGAYTTLSRRQELTPAPNALFGATAPWTGITDKPAGFADNVDNDSGGDITSVVTAAGSGLLGGSTAGDVNLSVGFGGNGAATTVARSDHNHDAAYQAVVTGTCPAGQGIQQVNSDGSVVCGSGNPQTGFAITTVDGALTNAGQYAAITIGADGLGLISYNYLSAQDLRVAHCTNTACTAATVTPIDTAGAVGFFTSAAIGPDGLGFISYRDGTNGDLKAAHCADAACTSASLNVIDSAGNAGFYTSATIGTDGLPLVSYQAGGGGLNVAHCTDLACATATITTLDSGVSVGAYGSVTVGADGLGIISYYDSALGDLKVAHCSNVACTAATVAPLDMLGVVGQYTSITVGSDASPLISYYDAGNGDLKIAHCSSFTCGSATINTLDAAGDVGQHTSITVGADGLAVVSYYDVTSGNLKVARCLNPLCSLNTVSTVDSAGDVGQFTSITIGTDGLPLIAYYDVGGQNLKVAHCSNVACTPFVRRR